MVSLKLFGDMSIVCVVWMKVCGCLENCIPCDNFECECSEVLKV